MGYTQSFLPDIYELPDTVPSRYRYDRYRTYANTKKVLNANNDRNLSSREEYIEEFSRKFAGSKAVFFNSGKIYFNWAELENYVNAVFKKVLEADGVVDDTTYHVYIMRSPEFNAFSTYDNTFYVNIGLLANIDDEAQLASVLAHELGHYRNYDSFNSFIELKKAAGTSKIVGYYGSLGKVLSEAVIKEYYLKMQNRERAADNFMIKLLPKSGYSLESAAAFHQIAQEYEIFDRKYIPVEFNYFYSTHPGSGERRATILKAGLNEPKGKTFQVSEELFNQFKIKAKYELLHLQLSEGKYHKCISHAFEYYLSEPANAIYVYYILESLRRWQMINPSVFKLNFITATPRMKSKKVLLNNVHSGYIKLSQLQLNNLPAEDLLDNEETPFETNAEAFIYFASKAEELNCVECYLTLALSEIEGMDGFLDRYLNFPKARYQEFAHAYKNRHLNKFPEKTGVFYSIGTNLNYPEEKEKQDSLSIHTINAFSESVSAYVDSLSRNTEGVVFSDNVRNYWNRYYDINMSLRFSSIINIYLESNPFYVTSELQYLNRMNYSLSKVQSIPWFILDPSHWTYFNTKKISSVFYLFNVLQSGTKDNSKLTMKRFYGEGCYLNMQWRSMYLTITDEYFKNRFSSCSRIETNLKWPEKISENIYKRKFLYTLKGSSIFTGKNVPDQENELPHEQSGAKEE